ncbi:ATP-binding protein [Streptomyces caeruleatus]|uniref:ATP-binding protein n=1 Tax=Streptomyces caeruleatus TaxID=661399 RepID=UPI00099E3265|nr:ATP-binding protein [Streptomyces caeruleatus]
MARDLVRTACITWGLTEEMTDTAALVIVELLSNAVRHAWGPSVRITVDRPSDKRVRLAVVDRAPDRLPHLHIPQDEEQSGRGLVLIEALSERWGYDRLGPAARPWGKSCWAELSVKQGDP